MERIKNYFRGWGAARIFRIVLAGAFGISYYYNRENILLILGIMFAIQAIFNLTCPGGSCRTNTQSDKKPTVEVEEYKPKE